MKRKTTWLTLDKPAKTRKYKLTDYLQEEQLSLQVQEEEEVKALVQVQMVSSPLEEILRCQDHDQDKNKHGQYTHNVKNIEDRNQTRKSQKTIKRNKQTHG